MRDLEADSKIIAIAIARPMDPVTLQIREGLPMVAVRGQSLTLTLPLSSKGSARQRLAAW